MLIESKCLPKEIFSIKFLISSIRFSEKRGVNFVKGQQGPGVA